MSIESRNVRWWLLVVVTAISLYLCWRMVQPFLRVILWATVLVILFYPVHKRLVQRIGRPWLAALISCALVILRSEEHTSELQSQSNLVCRLLLEKKNKNTY